MSKKRKNKKDILKNTLLISLSFILSIVLVFQIKESIGSIINKTMVDQIIDSAVSQVFSDNYPPPPLPPPPITACGDLLYDQDGHSYKTMEIAGQCWMAENLNTGVMLASVSTMPNSNDNIIEKWCHNNNLSFCETEGGLYSWDEAMQGSSTAGAQGICPPGWHIPTNNEWETIANLFTSDLNKFKTFFPFFLGRRYASGGFYDRAGYQFLWSSTEDNTTNARYWVFDSYYSFFNDYDQNKEDGFRVRCLMD